MYPALLARPNPPTISGHVGRGALIGIGLGLAGVVALVATSESDDNSMILVPIVMLGGAGAVVGSLGGLVVGVARGLPPG